MKYHKNNITKVVKIAPVYIYFPNYEESFKLKHGVHIINYDDNTVSTLDLKNDIDLTNENMEIMFNKKSKMKTIFDISKNDKYVDNEKVDV